MESVNEKMTKAEKDGIEHKEEVKKNKDSLVNKNHDKLEINKDNEDTEDSDSDFEDKNHFNESKKGCLLKEMSEMDLKKFSKKKIEFNKEQILRDRRKREVIQRFLDKSSIKKNDIFDNPHKSMPLPRKCCTINVTFTERAFPTPARESSHLEEQEVNICNYKYS